MAQIESRLKQLEARRGPRPFYAIVRPGEPLEERSSYGMVGPGKWPSFYSLEEARATCPKNTTFIVVKRDRKPLEDSINGRH